MMTPLPRALALVLALFVSIAPTVAVASVSSSYAVTGIETAATSTQGTFVGTATGSNGDDAVWQAVVVHHPLMPGCYLSVQGCSITGGTFSLVNEQVETITGDFASGSITLLRQAPGCGVQVFSVVGILTDVHTPTETGGNGTFSVTLTHFRALYHGQCTTFFAKVSGNVSF
jgi:hypothetical protein